MLTPTKLSSKPNVLPLLVPEYDFLKQSRWDGTVMAGSFTSNSIQTFNNNGQPNDAKSDNTD
jgi:hypothetical protein